MVTSRGFDVVSVNVDSAERVGIERCTRDSRTICESNRCGLGDPPELSETKGAMIKMRAIRF
jgi:hypothetical protein